MDIHVWTVKLANHTKSSQPNPQITELIIITMATTTYPTNCGISKMEDFSNYGNNYVYGFSEIIMARINW